MSLFTNEFKKINLKIDFSKYQNHIVFFFLFFFIAILDIHLFKKIFFANWGIYDWDLSSIVFLNGFNLKNHGLDHFLEYPQICGGLFNFQYIPLNTNLLGYLTFFFSNNISTIIAIFLFNFFGSFFFFMILKRYVNCYFAIILSLIWVFNGYFGIRFFLGHLTFISLQLIPVYAYFYLFKNKSIFNFLILFFVASQIVSFGMIYFVLYFIFFNFVLILYKNSFSIENLKNILKDSLYIFSIFILVVFMLMPQLLYAFNFLISGNERLGWDGANHGEFNSGFHVLEFIFNSIFANYYNSNLFSFLFNTTQSEAGMYGWAERTIYTGGLFLVGFMFLFLKNHERKRFLRNNFSLFIIIFISFLFCTNIISETLPTYQGYISLFSILNISEITGGLLRMPQRLYFIFLFFSLILLAKLLNFIEKSEIISKKKIIIFFIFFIFLLPLESFVSEIHSHFRNNEQSKITIFLIFLCSTAFILHAIFLKIDSYTNYKKFSINLIFLILLISFLKSFIFFVELYTRATISHQQSEEYLYLQSEFKEIEEPVKSQKYMNYWLLANENWMVGTTLCKFEPNLKNLTITQKMYLKYYNLFCFLFLISVFIYISLTVIYSSQRNKKLL